MQVNRLDEFVTLLSQLPGDTWEAAVKAGHGWNWMQPISKVWEFGHFADLFIVLGLNCYATIGKAGVGYWPRVMPYIQGKPDLAAPQHLIGILGPFFRGERLGPDKVRRLERFARSDLCRRIWTSGSPSIAADFVWIWQQLGSTMGQQPVKKTIALGMKFLAYALLMVGESRFDFSAIPVPVDSRIREVSRRLGLPDSSDAIERARWQQALNRIREVHPDTSMVHLDSLLWQIGTLSEREIEAHLRELGVGGLATRISSLLPNVSAPIPRRRTCI